MSRKVIPYSRQKISQQDIDAVIEVLKSDFLTTGPKVDEFEKAVADYCGAKYAVAVANATAALHIAARAIDLSPGDKLWTSPNTFVASANCAEHCGADADFVDIDPSTLNLSAIELEKKLKISIQAPAAVVAVHFAGRPCDMKAIDKLRKQYSFKVIEDAAHAIGSVHCGQRVGSCEFSDMTIFSFHPVKNITTGEGGLITTNDSELYERLRVLRSIGITRDQSRMSGPSHGAWYYEQVEFGFNYRLTDIGAALGLSQLKQLGKFVDDRQLQFDRYCRELRDLPLDLPPPATDRTAWHLFPIQLRLNELKVTRRQVFDKLREAGIFVNVHYIPVHTQPVYLKKGFKKGQFPNSENYYDRAISLPLFSGMSDEEQTYVITKLREYLT